METEPPDHNDGPEPTPADDAADEALLRALGGRERAQQIEAERGPLTEPWAALLAGELDPASARAQAQAAGMGDDDLARAEAYFRPFDADEREGLVDALLAGLAEDENETEAETETETEAETEAETETEAEPVGNVIPLPRAGESSGGAAEPEGPRHEPGSGPWWWIPGGMLIAAAAAIVAWVVWPPSEELLGPTTTTSNGDDSGQLAMAALPDYVLETDGGLKVVRGDDTGPSTDTAADPDAGRHRYGRDTRFEWILRPKLEVSGEVDVRGFAFAGETLSAGLPLALTNMVQVAPSGSIRISGTIADLGLEPGRYTIVLVVGRPEDLPQQAQAVRDDADVPWQVRRIAVSIED